MSVRVAQKVRAAVGPWLVRAWLGRAASRLLRDRIPHRGLIVDTRSPAITDSVKAALLLRAYESAEYRFVRRYIPAHCDVVELGASIGVMTCHLRRKLDPRNRLVAVEADAMLKSPIEANLALNASSSVELVVAAVDYSGAELVSFDLSGGSLGGAVNRKAQPTEAGVRTVRLRELVEQSGLSQFSTVVDIEGAEWDIWRHDRDVLRRTVANVWELHDSPDGQPWQGLRDEIATDPDFEAFDEYGPVIVFRPRPMEQEGQ